MIAIISKRVVDKDFFVRLSLPKDYKYNHRLISRLKIKPHIVINDDFNFNYNTDELINIIEFISGVLERFEVTLEKDESINKEIKNYELEQKNFKVFSKNAYQIRNNDFKNIDDLNKKFNDFREVIESKLTRKLYDLQFLSAFHMAYTVNSMNFSVPGSGKTSIVYAAYSYLKSIGLVEKLFVIGPLSSFQAWESEFESCFNLKPSVYRYSGVEGLSREEKKNHIYSSNPSELNLIYFQAVDGLSQDLINFMSKYKVMIVVDEAHRIKNADGNWGKNITKISEAAKSRVALTGTPIPNGFQDIYNIIKFIYPFKFKSILNFHYSQLEELSIAPVDVDRLETLKNNLSPFFMRIRKEDLSNLPTIKEKEVKLTMGDLQNEIYSYINSLVDKLQFSTSSNFETDFIIRAMLIRLRQAATNPFLLSMSLEKSIAEDFYFDNQDKISTNLNSFDDEIFEFDFREKIKNYNKKETPIKIKYCIERTNEIINNGFNSKVLIWTIFTENAKYINRELKKIGIKSEFLIGEVETSKREEIVNEFNNRNSNLKVVIANPFTVGESVSLHHGCNYAIYLERDYNCSNFVQSKDRIHRVGSKFETVNYEYLISDFTIDEVISDRLKFKVDRMSDLVDDEIPFFKALEDDNEEALIIKNALKLYKLKP